MSKVSYDKHNPQSIQEMFGSIAKRYDRANAVLSLNMHKYWNRKLINFAVTNTPGRNFLDLCSGTGDIAFGIAKACEFTPKICLLDFCAEMLEFAKQKEPVDDSLFTYIQGDAQDLPLENGTVDCITISYGIRNVKSPEKCIGECMRVLRKDGVLAILELTRPEHPFMRFGHQLYLKGILPIMGKLVAENKQAYEYLCSSIDNFVAPQELTKIMVDKGFNSVNAKPLTGGVATLLTGFKNL